MQTVETETPVNSDAPVRRGSTFATLLEEMCAMTQELGARREFDEEVVTWLRQTGQLAKFEEWRRDIKRGANEADEPGVAPV